MSSCCCGSAKSNSTKTSSEVSSNIPLTQNCSDRRIVHHLVLLKFRDDVSPEDLCAFYDAIKSLKKVKGVLHAAAGKQEVMYPGYTDRAQGYNYAV